MTVQVLELIEQARLTLLGELDLNPSYRALKALDRSLAELRAILGADMVPGGEARMTPVLAASSEVTQEMLDSIAERAVQSVAIRQAPNPFAQAPRVAQVARI